MAPSWKNGTLLWEKDFEALIDRVLRLITLKLSKIWIGGEVEDEAVFQNEFAVEAGASTEIFASKERMRGIPLVEHMEGIDEPVGDELDVAAGTNVFEAVKFAFLTETAIDAGGNVREKTVVVAVRDYPLKKDAPGLLTRAGETQALERNRHKRNIAL